MSGAKIIESLKEAIRGDLSRVWIDGVCWAPERRWQDISTAPKDGTKVDLLYPYPRGRTVDCYWDASRFGDGGIWMWRTATWKDGQLLPESKWDMNWYPNEQPTHWMRLPEPPEGSL